MGPKRTCENLPFRVKTHLRGDAELRRQVEQHRGNILDHLHHQVFAAEKKGQISFHFQGCGLEIGGRGLPVGQTVPLED